MEKIEGRKTGLRKNIDKEREGKTGCAITDLPIKLLILKETHLY